MANGNIQSRKRREQESHMVRTEDGGQLQETNLKVFCEGNESFVIGVCLLELLPTLVFCEFLASIFALVRYEIVLRDYTSLLCASQRRRRETKRESDEKRCESERAMKERVRGLWERKAHTGRCSGRDTSRPARLRPLDHPAGPSGRPPRAPRRREETNLSHKRICAAPAPSHCPG